MNWSFLLIRSSQFKKMTPLLNKSLKFISKHVGTLSCPCLHSCLLNRFNVVSHSHTERDPADSLWQIRQLVHQVYSRSALYQWCSSLCSVQAQSPVLQSKMLVPMATVGTGSTPPQPISLVGPPLPVQNGAPGSKVH